jgi:hypothetical protein
MKTLETISPENSIYCVTKTFYGMYKRTREEETAFSKPEQPELR